jgi:hypothetical protein
MIKLTKQTIKEATNQYEYDADQELDINTVE